MDKNNSSVLVLKKYLTEQDWKELIKGDIPYSEKQFINVSEDEILISSGDFWRLQQHDKFTSNTTDENDSLKLIGFLPGGEKCVAMKSVMSMSEEEFNEYTKRSDEYWASSEIEIHEAKWVSEAKDLTEINYNKASYSQEN